MPPTRHCSRRCAPSCSSASCRRAPGFFEQVIVDLLVTMGDGGVDDVINEDRLGLDASIVSTSKPSATRHRAP